MYRNLLGVISVDFDETDQLLIIYSAFVKYLREKGNKMKQLISYAVAWTGLICIRTGTDGGHL
jgi:predicted NUDIX family phosphoesterase